MEWCKVQKNGISQKCNKKLAQNKSIIKLCLTECIFQRLAFFCRHNFWKKIESYRLANSLKIKSSNGNVPWNVYKYSIHKLITTTLNWCDDENYFSREKAE